MLQARQIRRELCHVMGYGRYEANMEPNMESTWSQCQHGEKACLIGDLKKKSDRDQRCT